MLGWRKNLLVCAIAITTPTAVNTAAVAASEGVIHSFPYGANPVPPLMQRTNGTLIGVAHNAGSGYGAVFQLREQNRAWKEKELFRFLRSSAYPSNVIEHKGTLYGVTAEGGEYGAGTIFSLTRTDNVWTEWVLYSFTGGKDGSNPDMGLLWVKQAGAFFGVAPANTFAPPNCGTVLTITTEGAENTIHRFKGDIDGCSPDAELQELHTGKALTLVGTTTWGGEGNGGSGNGTVFVVTEGNGHWHESVIYRFTGGGDGAFPGTLVIDGGGNIFGVASGGGAYGEGVVFELGRNGGRWVEKTIYAFAGGSDGENPSGLCRDSATGNLYGVTTYGGASRQGTVFKLIPVNGSWSESVLHSFGATGDGQYPEARPIYDAQARVLYGTTRYGGKFDGGIVYAVSLSGSWRR